MGRGGATAPPAPRLSRRGRDDQLRPLRRHPRAPSRRGEGYRLAGGEGTGQGRRQLSPARLAHQPPALLGRAHPHRLLRKVRHRPRPLRGPARPPAGRCGLHADGRKPAQVPRGLPPHHLPQVRRPRHPRNGHDGHLYVLLLVPVRLPQPLLQGGRTGPRRFHALGPGGGRLLAAGRYLHGRRGARHDAPALHALLHQGAARRRPGRFRRADAPASQPGHHPGRAAPWRFRRGGGPLGRRRAPRRTDPRQAPGGGVPRTGEGQLPRLGRGDEARRREPQGADAPPRRQGVGGRTDRRPRGRGYAHQRARQEAGRGASRRHPLPPRCGEDVQEQEERHRARCAGRSVRGRRRPRLPDVRLAVGTGRPVEQQGHRRRRPLAQPHLEHHPGGAAQAHAAHAGGGEEAAPNPPRDGQGRHGGYGELLLQHRHRAADGVHQRAEQSQSRPLGKRPLGRSGRHAAAPPRPRHAPSGRGTVGTARQALQHSPAALADL